MKKREQFNEDVTKKESVSPLISMSGISQSLYSKKRYRRLISALEAIIVMVSVVFGTFYLTDTANASSEGKKEAAEYYHKIETANREASIDNWTGFYGLVLKTYQEQIMNGLGQAVSVKGILSDDMAEEMDLQGVKDFEIKVESMSKNMSGKTKYIICLNGKDLISYETFIDSEKGIVYGLFPEISKSYIKAPFEDVYGTGGYSTTSDELQKWFLDNPFTEKILNGLLKKYSKIVTDELNNVTLKENVEVSADGVTGEFNEITVSITEFELYNIMKAVLTAASTDETMAFLCEKSGICTQAEYKKEVKEVLSYLKDPEMESMIQEYNEENFEELFKINVWVDSTGKIRGRELRFGDYEYMMSLGYQSVTDGAKTGFELWVSENQEDTYTIKANGITNSSSNFTGEAVASLSQYDEDLLTYKLAMKNANFKNLFEGYLDGSFQLTCSELKDTSININCYGSPSQQNVKTDVVKDGVNEMSIAMDLKTLYFTGFYLPTDTERMFDLETEMEEYWASADTESFIGELYDKIESPQLRAKLDELLKGELNQ